MSPGTDRLVIPVTRLGLPAASFEGQAARLGSGSFSEVWLCQRRFKGGELQRVAVKILKKPLAQCSDDELTWLSREAINQGGLAQHHVCQLLEVGLTQRVERLSAEHDGRERIYLVLEYAEGGTLREYLIARGGKLEEKWARWFFLQLLSGLRYCHAHSVFNRDIKPSNCLMSASSGNVLLKVADFGLSKCPHIHGELSSQVGTLLYMAPEVYDRNLQDAQGPYDGGKVDVYSCGVTLAEMVVGRPPFYVNPQSGAALNTFASDRTTYAILQANKAAGLMWPRNEAPALPEDLRELLEGMLRPRPQERLSLAQVLAHPWSRRDVKEAVLAHLDNELPTPTAAHAAFAANFRAYVDQQFAFFLAQPCRQALQR